jgi:hypothetical protein
VERLAEATRRALGFRFPVTFQAVNIHHSLFLSVKVFRKSPPSPVLPPPSISSDMSISLPIIPSHSASSANSTPRNRPVDLPSPTSEAVQEDKAEFNGQREICVAACVVACSKILQVHAGARKYT